MTSKPEPGTRVSAVLGGVCRFGVVMPYDVGLASTAVPIRFDDEVWRQFSADEVEIVEVIQDCGLER
ncbi:hypothetical protein BC739_006579 [Kutzneria viridogrisea]|nr:hypothetical protein [Kutzneria albida]MBA8929361.1 hypothetical protein [Kutzneria viridogrisea]